MGRLQVQVAELSARVVELEAENAELRHRLGSDSTNSSKPPSLDGLGKAPPVSLRPRNTGRRPGGQFGHAPGRLEQVERPDHVVVHRPVRCGGCAADLPVDAPASGAPVVRQVFDLPAKIDVIVTEHRMVKVACRCGHATRAEAPAEAAGPTNLGYGITAVAAYLSAGQLIPVDRVAQTIHALFGVSVSTGWVSLAAGDVEQAVEGANTRIREMITTAPVAHFDESVTKLGGRQHWFHAAATPSLTAYHADEHGRGLGSMTAFGILPSFTGVAVHDAYSAYYSPALTAAAANDDGEALSDMVSFGHALCIQHVQRELRGITEHDPVAARDGWAAALDLHIGDLFRWRDHWADAGAGRLPDFKRAKAFARWDELIEHALTTHPHQRGRPGGQTHARRLAVRLGGYRDDYLRWLDDFTIPATNNEAERTIRMIKSKTKVSGGFRTLQGLQRFLRIRGYLDTLRKNGHDLITSLRDALNGQAWTPG